MSRHLSHSLRLRLVLSAATLLMPAALGAQTYTITGESPAAVASNANGANLTLTGTLPTNFGVGGYAYCFYTGYGSTTPITPASTGPTVIAVPASTINSVPSTSFVNGVFNASLYVIKPLVGAAVNCTGAADGTLTNTVSYPIAQVPTLASFDVTSIPAPNAATGIQAPPYALIFTGTGLVTSTTINYTWTGGSGNGTVKYGSGTTLVVTVPATIPATLTSIQATACNQAIACSTPFKISLTALNSASGTLTATPNPATVQQPVTLTSTFAPGPNTVVSAGAPSGTVTFESGTTTLGSSKLVLDKTTATLKSPIGITLNGTPSNTFQIADVNGDGIPDVVFVDTASPKLLHVDLGSTPYGTFQADLTRALPAGCTTVNTMAMGDLNGDGFADLVVDCSNGTGVVSVYSLLSNGDSTFAPANQVTPVFGTQVALKDMNKDGKLDLVVAGRTQGNACVTNCSGFVLFKGNGDGTFTNSVTTSISGSASSNLLLADIDGDGYPDIVELNNLSQGTQSIDIYLNNTAMSFGTSASPIFTPSASIPLISYPTTYKFLFIGDFNGDGLPDLGTVVSPAGTASIVSALNTSSPGKPSFGAPSSFATTVGINDIVVGDINGDGFSDLLITANPGSAQFLEAQGNGSFGNAYTGLAVAGFTVADMQAADLNGDGYADPVVLSTLSATYFLTGYITSGSAVATLPTTFAQSGSPSLTATWPGNINFSGATGKLTLMVNPASSSTSLGTSGTPSVYGQPVTFTATVSSTTATGTPTGTITFLDGTVPLGLPVNMSGGSASFTLPTLTAGTHSISTAYSGDTVFSSGVPALVTQVVNQAQPVVTWNPSPANITYGTTLVAGQLNATAATPFFATVPGSFNYTPAVSALLGAGNQTLNATFTPTDTIDFKTATGTANISIAKFTPTVNWNTPAAIVVGTPLSATQLNGHRDRHQRRTARHVHLHAGRGHRADRRSQPGAERTLYTPPTSRTTPPPPATPPSRSFSWRLRPSLPTPRPSARRPRPSLSPARVSCPTPSSTSTERRWQTYAYVNATTITATIPTSLLQTPQTLNVTVFDPTQNQTSAAGTFTVIAPPVVASLTGPGTALPAQQPTVNFALGNPYPVALAGTLTLTFAGNRGRQRSRHPVRHRRTHPRLHRPGQHHHRAHHSTAGGHGRRHHHRYAGAYRRRTDGHARQHRAAGHHSPARASGHHQHDAHAQRR